VMKSVDPLFRKQDSCLVAVSRSRSNHRFGRRDPNTLTHASVDLASGGPDTNPRSRTLGQVGVAISAGGRICQPNSQDGELTYDRRSKIVPFHLHQVSRMEAFLPTIFQPLEITLVLQCLESRHFSPKMNDC
jgi:hypothetical protein